MTKSPIDSTLTLKFKSEGEILSILCGLLRKLELNCTDLKVTKIQTIFVWGH